MKISFLYFPDIFLLVGEAGLVVGLSCGDEVVDDACEFVGGGGDGFGRAEVSAFAAEEVADGGGTASGSVSGHSQGVGGSAGDFTSACFQLFAVRNPVVRA